jgi:hypothetical protein
MTPDGVPECPSTRTGGDGGNEMVGETAVTVTADDYEVGVVLFRDIEQR